MIDIPSLYQSVFFTDISEVKPSSETIPTLMKALGQYGLLPSTFQELAVTGSSQVRLKLSTPVSNEWTVQIETNRINILKNAIDFAGEKIGTLDEFCEDSANMLDAILVAYPRKSSRLSLVSNWFSQPIGDSTLDAAYEKVLQPIKYFSDARPTDWQARHATKVKTTIRKNEETLNVIAAISRVQGEFAFQDKQETFDRVKVDLDINTNQRNTAERFTLGDMKEFVQTAKELTAEIKTQVESNLV